MDNKILILGALAIGLYMMSGSGGGPRYYVPGVGYVPEADLPSMGYVNVGGKWYSQAQVDAAAAQAGVSAGTVSPGSSAWNTIAAILAAAIPLVTTIVNTTGGSGGSNDGSMGGMYGINRR